MARNRAFSFTGHRIAAGLLLGASLLPLIAGPARAQTAEPRQEGWQHYPEQKHAMRGAPNILIVMTDDVGFGAASTFGGLIPTPHLDDLAEEGLRYTQFHTTAMCSPTRAALLTGRNHHSVNTGAIGNLSLDREGYTSVMPKSAATIGTVLGRNGYHTAWIGKNHNTPLWEDTPMGPFDRWPNGLGFDYFYGFNGSQTDQFAPALIENRNRVPVPDDPDYVFERDMADHAIGWLRQQESMGNGAPFLLYYAPGTAHAPLQAPKEWIERFDGVFDMGWDEMRAEICRRQLESLTVPESTECTPRPEQIPAWSSLGEGQQDFAARLMETYAAMLAFSDDQFGRIVEELKRSGRYENTLILFIEGDNGASSESLTGNFNEIAMFNQSDTLAEDIELVDDIGGPESRPVNAAGWAWAMNAPFQWSKQIASHFGGTRNGLVVSWPEGIADQGGIRRHFHHVVDIAPTLYEIVGITPPEMVDGVAQQPLAGVSMAGSFDGYTAVDAPRTQYFEMLGNRAIYKDGWVAATTPRRMPWSATYLQPEYNWELYNVSEDFSEARDLADSEPERLEALKQEFEVIAEANKVLPIDDSFLPRFGPALRPSAFAAGGSFTFYPAEHSFSATAFPTLNSDWVVSSRVSLTGNVAHGPVIMRGDRFGGWGLFMDQGRARLVYRLTHLPEDMLVLESPEALAPGDHAIDVSVMKLGGGRHRLVLSVDGEEAAAQEITGLAFGRVETSIGRQGDIPMLPDFAENADGVSVESVQVDLLD